MKYYFSFGRLLMLTYNHSHSFWGIAPQILVSVADCHIQVSLKFEFKGGLKDVSKTRVEKGIRTSTVPDSCWHGEGRGNWPKSCWRHTHMWTLPYKFINSAKSLVHYYILLNLVSWSRKNDFRCVNSLRNFFESSSDDL